MNKKQSVTVRGGAIQRVPYPRGHQPQCINVLDESTGRICNHPISLHGKSRTKCQAIGCQCERLVLEEEPDPESVCV